jgi:periplasmic copper chaperone A
MLAVALAIAVVATDASAVLIVREPWVRPSATAGAAEGFIELQSTEGATLVDVRCATAVSIAMLAPGAPRKTVRAIDLPAGRTVMLAPGKHRLALDGLSPPPRYGDRVAIVLTIAAADGSRREIPVNAEVRRHSPTDDHLHGHKH